MTRSSLCHGVGGMVGRAAAAVLILGLGVACGGGAAAPTSTAVPTLSASPAVPVPSPQRPALASPLPSPSIGGIAAPTPTAATAADTGGDSYVVQSGDTLLSIAQQYYGDTTQWRRIYDANTDTIGADPDKLTVGMKLTIPPKQS